MFGCLPTTGSTGKTARNKQEINQPARSGKRTGRASGKAIGQAARPSIPTLRKKRWKKDTTLKKKTHILTRVQNRVTVPYLIHKQYEISSGL